VARPHSSRLVMVARRTLVPATKGESKDHATSESPGTIASAAAGEGRAAGERAR